MPVKTGKEKSLFAESGFTIETSLTVPFCI
jgi:hypothetical protein